MDAIEKDFVDFAVKVWGNFGLDQISSQLFAILFIHPSEMCLEELSLETGYSLASVSNKMRFLENFGLVRRIRKPQSKKAYFYAEKEIAKIVQLKAQRFLENYVKPAQANLPTLIEKYKKQKLNESQQKKLAIIINYHGQMHQVERTLKEITAIKK